MQRPWACAPAVPRTAAHTQPAVNPTHTRASNPNPALKPRSGTRRCVYVWHGTARVSCTAAVRLPCRTRLASASASTLASSYMRMGAQELGNDPQAVGTTHAWDTFMTWGVLASYWEQQPAGGAAASQQRLTVRLPAGWPWQPRPAQACGRSRVVGVGLQLAGQAAQVGVRHAQRAGGRGAEAARGLLRASTRGRWAEAREAACFRPLPGLGGLERIRRRARAGGQAVALLWAAVESAGASRNRLSVSCRLGFTSGLTLVAFFFFPFFLASPSASPAALRLRPAAAGCRRCPRRHSSSLLT